MNDMMAVDSGAVSSPCLAIILELQPREPRQVEIFLCSKRAAQVEDNPGSSEEA